MQNPYNDVLQPAQIQAVLLWEVWLITVKIFFPGVNVTRKVNGSYFYFLLFRVFIYLSLFSQVNVVDVMPTKLLLNINEGRERLLSVYSLTLKFKRFVSCEYFSRYTHQWTSLFSDMNVKALTSTKSLHL